MIVNLIAAVDKITDGIGMNGGIPWSNKEDMQWFKQHTINNAVIMGWTTFVSLGKPLKNRLNIVLTTSHDAKGHYENDDNVRTARSIDESLEIARNEGYEIVYVIGGASIYEQFLERDLVDTLYIDKINNTTEYEYDTKFPFHAMHDEHNGSEPFRNSWSYSSVEKSKDNLNTFMICHRMRTTVESDSQYLFLLEEIMHNGAVKDTRAGKTRSLFGRMMTFPMSNGLPVLTTKKMYMKGCIHELLWFLRGDANIKYLIDHDTHIWDDDAYRWYMKIVDRFNEINGLKEGNSLQYGTKAEFIEKVRNGYKIRVGKDTYTCGDLGPVYGKQWNDCNGHSQIDELIETLKSNPDDRRMIVNAWNVDEIGSMALPPCHYSFQCYTRPLRHNERFQLYCKMAGENAKGCSNEDYMTKVMDEMNVPSRAISLMWNQRSVDTCLGLPYNIMSYGLLLSMIAHVVNMQPDKLSCSLGDTHVYENQMHQAKMQLERNPYLYKSPKLVLNENVHDIHAFGYDDIKIEGYESYPTLKYELSVGLLQNPMPTSK